MSDEEIALCEKLVVGAMQSENKLHLHSVFEMIFNLGRFSVMKEKELDKLFACTAEM